ncbi:MAG: putative bifunctional diguanylate cyclase/phosphodiesterase [Rhizobiaceae bacterium]
MLFKAANSLVEKSIGVDGLDQSRRTELACIQFSSVAKIIPSIIIGSVLLVALLVFFFVEDGNYTPIAIWATALSFVHLFGLEIWSQFRKKTDNDSSPANLDRICGYAGALGMMFAVLPIFAFSQADTDFRILGIISTVGILYSTGFAFASVPQAVISFSFPAVTGAIAGISIYSGSYPKLTAAMLVLAFVLTMALISIRSTRDLARQIVTQATIRDQKNSIEMLLHEYEQNANDWLWEINPDGELERASSGLRKLLDIPDGKQGPFDLLKLLRSLCPDPQMVDQVEARMKTRHIFKNLHILLWNSGSQHWISLSGKPNIDHDGKYLGYIGIGKDISSQKSAEAEIEKLAHCDTLTGLLNRASFNKAMDQSVSALNRDGTNFSILFLDLDRFKLINDTRGHLVGDQLLREVARRIRICIRENDIVARLGGDEFGIILNDGCNPKQVAAFAERIISEISKPYKIDSERYKIGASIGIALAPIHGTNPIQLLGNADLALYRAKSEGRGQHRFFENHMDEEQREKRLLEQELRGAIDREEFELFYQPQCSAEDGRTTGMEALIRWNHPVRGQISPVDFIPIAEQSSMVQELGVWAIGQACKAALAWPDDVVVAVNISAHHFIGADIVDYTRKALREAGLPPERLELEITESLLMTDSEEAQHMLRQLKELGVTIALDDFGTGFSSLSYIVNYPFDKIKIDQSFVRSVDSDSTAQAILQMIAGLGKTLDLAITAEGVETKEQIGFLRTINCQQLQGYYFAKPMKEMDVPSFIAANADGWQNEPGKDSGQLAGKIKAA